MRPVAAVGLDAVIADALAVGHDDHVAAAGDLLHGGEHLSHQQRLLNIAGQRVVQDRQRGLGGDLQAQLHLALVDEAAAVAGLDEFGAPSGIGADHAR